MYLLILFFDLFVIQRLPVVSNITNDEREGVRWAFYSFEFLMHMSVYILYKHYSVQFPTAIHIIVYIYLK